MANSVRSIASSPQTIAKHYSRLLALWPQDALRPNLPFARAIEHRAEPYGVQPTSSSSSSSSPRTPSLAGAPSARTRTTALNPHAEAAQITALYSLLENRYSKQYALSAEVLRPASNPEHYTRLMEEIERAPGKSWFAAKMDEWKRKIRWS